MKKDTRKLLLDSGFQEFYKNGYQGASITTILRDVGINKGSMYHFFASKKVLALSVIEERIAVNLESKYRALLDESFPLEALFETLKSAPTSLVYGCPLNKLAQEMAYLDSDFKQVLVKVYESFEDVIGELLTLSVSKKELHSFKKEQTPKLIISTYEGALMIYHLTQNRKDFEDTLEILKLQLLSERE